MNEAFAKYRAGKRSGAKGVCEGILAQDSNHGPARHLLGVVSLELGKLDEGVAHLEILVSLYPDYPGAQALLAKALANTGRTEDAIEALKAAIASEPDQHGYRIALAGFLAQMEDFSTALDVLQPVLALNPNDPSLLNNIGGLLARNGELEEAVSYFERAVQASDVHAVSHYNLAKALKDVGKQDKALKHYKRTVELDPGFATAWRNLGNLYLDIGEVALGAKAYDRGTALKWAPDAKRAPDESHQKTSRSKLQHDIEQLEYLLAHNRLSSEYQQLLDGYRAVLEGLPATGEKSEVVDVPEEHRKYLTPYFNRLFHRPSVPALSGPAVNPNFDVAAVEADYVKNAPGMTFADGFLTEEALRELRRFCLESTVWYKHSFAKGYVGAFMEDGFVCPLLLQIADELRKAFPAIFGDHTLRKLWAFKYDSRLSGIPIHADFAAVNVNFWITPEAANKDPETGGLVVWDKEAPLNWDFKTYNADEQAMRSFIAESGAKPYTIPHRENRMVMFNSDLIHETGELNFEEGYENRRINITMLYGKRENST
ncbi:tetratricopeptide repeat protein [Pelagibius sp. Alg239-R121]|uniref:tetratricopeptide repeat protein n=1 Tax=Pelagibius sp. Alg239-R121 TaxID=2993448 RepID=UPI0024A76BEA|nr:tetratricopeptide repeat protein [Pelagibius sp. Alg239-R121]